MSEVDADARWLRLHVVLKRRENQNQLADQTAWSMDLQMTGCRFLVSQPVANIEDLARDVLFKVESGRFMYRPLHNRMKQVVQSAALPEDPTSFLALELLSQKPLPVFFSLQKFVVSTLEFIQQRLPMSFDASLQAASCEL